MHKKITLAANLTRVAGVVAEFGIVKCERHKLGEIEGALIINPFKDFLHQRSGCGGIADGVSLWLPTARRARW